MKYDNLGLPYEREIRAAIAAAPRNPDDSYLMHGTAETALDAPNMVCVGTPEQLEQILQSYALLTNRMPLPAHVIKEKIGHEVEHRVAAVALGATAIKHGLFIPSKPGFKLRAMRKEAPYQLSTIPDGLDEDQLTNVTAYPTILSPGDRWSLECSGTTIEEVNRIALERDWPRPLSLQLNE